MYIMLISGCAEDVFLPGDYDEYEKAIDQIDSIDKLRRIYGKDKNERE